MKLSRAQIRRKFKKIPYLQFESESAMTSCAGLVVFQGLFYALALKARLCRCFAHLDAGVTYPRGVVMLLLVVQIILGQRRLRGRDHLAGDPMVQRVVGLAQLPDVATLSRTLSQSDDRSVARVRRLSRGVVLDRLAAEAFTVVTLDYDGSVQSTTGHAEGTAVGFNKKKKGARSYYPLFCSVAQTGQIYDLHHRPGNVHDSNGARVFMKECRNAVLCRLPKAHIESRFDSAFFNGALLNELDEDRVEFTGSVPFQKFPELKRQVEATTDGKRLNKTWSYADSDWKPKSWKTGHRLLLLRKRSAVQRKGPLQLDLFEPRDHQYEYKVIVTNKKSHARTVLHFHNGRGSQEKILGEGKQHAALDVVATRTRNGNQLFTLAGILAHNLTRELQMRAGPTTRSTWPRRPARWVFESLGSLRQRILLRPGRFLNPQGRLTLRIAAEPTVQADIRRYVAGVMKAS